MDWMEKKLSNKFPYPKYYQVVMPKIGSAMENISMTVWDIRFLVDENYSREYGDITEYVNVHEMAHSYFGDSVGMRYFEHAWLKESWATYMEACWAEDNISKDEFDYVLYLNSCDYFDECQDQYVRPIVSKNYMNSWHVFDGHLYPGGGWRLHMLRKLLGDSDFWEAVGNYLRKNAFSLVETDDFRKELEKQSKLNLTKFFDQWIYSVGYPQLNGNFEYDSEKSISKITIEQVQPKEHVKHFEFDLEIEIVDTEDQSHLKTIHIKGEKHSIEFDKKVKSIAVDPHCKVLF
eukprot:TRINITY_DN3449_c0_g1_i6.p1 TRINITY_DN3449_c0_g1~~TRINITY_DN3449_c0_g1_i6.p1  ORF type:complete len:290 (+),score=71.31 TRINITY_DN3449_c0_g1_i6:780-1649(+)